MSNYSSGSSGVVSVGIPRTCRCGSPVVKKLSKSDANPYRRYYRCGFAAANRLVDDKHHLFKWEDEIVVKELEIFATSIDRIEKEVNELRVCIGDYQRLVKQEIEREGLEKIEAIASDAKWSMKCTIFGVVLVCLVSIGINKLV